MDFIRREPAAIAGAVAAILALVMGFGLHISSDQASLIEAAVAAVLGLVVRSAVTPTASTPAAPDAGSTTPTRSALGA